MAIIAKFYISPKHSDIWPLTSCEKQSCSPLVLIWKVEFENQNIFSLWGHFSLFFSIQKTASDYVCVCKQNKIKQNQATKKLNKNKQANAKKFPKNVCSDSKSFSSFIFLTELKI